MAASDYVYFIAGVEILLSSRIMQSGVLAGVENESTGTRPEPVDINHTAASRTADLFSDPISRWLLSPFLVRFSFSLPSFFPSRGTACLFLAFYSNPREHVCVDARARAR